MVKNGQVVKVTVTEVDVARKRIGLTMRKDGGASARDERQMRGGGAGGGKPQRGGGKGPAKQRGAMSSSPKGGAKAQGALGAALMDAFKKT